MSHFAITFLVLAACLGVPPIASAEELKQELRQEAKPGASEAFLLQLMAGRNAAKLGKYELAAARFRRLLDQAPHLTEARVELGWVLLNAGKLEDSLAEFQRAVKEAPKNETALRGLLEAYRKAKHPTGILETLRTLVALHGQDKDLLAQLAFELHNQGQFEEAERHFAVLLGEGQKK